MNVYGPCDQRETFWRRLLNFSLLAQEHTILGGDLNFSLGFSESWGHSAQVDAITEFMRNILDQKNFIDVPMQKPQPTWRNRRVGTVALARRLDRFLMKGPLLKQFHHYKQWVGSGVYLITPPYIWRYLGHTRNQKPLLNSTTLGYKIRIS